jgi:hypothetical protein
MLDDGMRGRSTLVAVGSVPESPSLRYKRPSRHGFNCSGDFWHDVKKSRTALALSFNGVIVACCHAVVTIVARRDGAFAILPDAVVLNRRKRRLEPMPRFGRRSQIESTRDSAEFPCLRRTAAAWYGSLAGNGIGQRSGADRGHGF